VSEEGNIIDETAVIDPSAKIGPNVVIGPYCSIGAGVKICDSTIFEKTTVKPYSLVKGSIIGWKNTVGSWVRITELTCTAEDVQVKDETSLTGTKVLPHKGIAGVYGDEVVM
jgi:mannose-1-phosphate guanylyltransferase